MSIYAVQDLLRTNCTTIVLSPYPFVWLWALPLTENASPCSGSQTLRHKKQSYLQSLQVVFCQILCSDSQESKAAVSPQALYRKPPAWRRNFSKFSSPHFRTGWEQHSIQHWQPSPLLQHRDKPAIQSVDSQNRIQQPSGNFIFVQTTMASKPLGALAYSTGFSCSHYHHATNSTRTHTFHDLFHECNTPFQVPSRCIVIVHELSHLIFFVPHSFWDHFLLRAGHASRFIGSKGIKVLACNQRSCTRFHHCESWHGQSEKGFSKTRWSEDQ